MDLVIPERPTGLNRRVCAALLLCGPVLIAVFWLSTLFLDEGRPYWKSDLTNGIVASTTALVLLGLGAAVVATVRRGMRATFVNWPAALVLLAASGYCGFFGVGYLAQRGEGCATAGTASCWYEILQLVWWALFAVTWAAAGVLALAQHCRDAWAAHRAPSTFDPPGEVTAVRASPPAVP